MNIRKMIKPSLLLIEGIIVILLYYSLVVMHENAHAQTLRYFGVSSEFRYSWGFPVATVPTDVAAPMSDESWRMVNGLNAMNDIFFYQFQVVYIFFAVIFLLMSILIIGMI